MKRIIKNLSMVLIFVAIVISFAGCNSIEKTDKTESGIHFVDAISYNMELALDVKSQTLTEIVYMEIENKTDKALSEICIRDMTPSALKYIEEFYSEDNKNLKTQIFSKFIL